MSARVRGARSAATFVDRAGIALVFPIADVVLPSLWEATTGTREIDVFELDERGKNVLTPELRTVWTLYNTLAERRLACVGKHVHGRLAAISLDLLASRYALTGRDGRADDFRSSDLPALDLELAEALLEHGPQTAPELRRLLDLGDARTVKRALESLQRRLVATQAGEAEQEQGWAATVFDLVARRFGDRLDRLPDRDEACDELARVVLQAARELSAADLAVVLGIRRSEATAVLDRLTDEGHARRHDEDGFTLWTARRRAPTGPDPGTRPNVAPRSAGRENGAAGRVQRK